MALSGQTDGLWDPMMRGGEEAGPGLSATFRPQNSNRVELDHDLMDISVQNEGISSIISGR